MEFFSKINWIDIFIILLIARSFVVGIKRGIAVEVFKFLGTVASIFVSLQYYIKLAGILKVYLPLNIELVEDFCFLILAVVSYLAFVLLRNLFLLIFKFETVTVIEKILGFIIGFFRGVLFSSLILVFFVLINNSYLYKSINKSLMGNNILAVSGETYNFVFEKIAKNILPQQEKNNYEKFSIKKGEKWNYLKFMN